MAAGRHAAHSRTPHAIDDDTAIADALRDGLTRDRLARAVEHLAGVEVLTFMPDWWDGQAHEPCLVVRAGRRHRRQRVVEHEGDAIVLPFDERSAKRRLARLERKRISIAAANDVSVDAAGDAIQCTGTRCGALIPIDYPGGACPVCGASEASGAAGGVGDNEEKSTATGARTAGSSISK